MQKNERTSIEACPELGRIQTFITGLFAGPTATSRALDAIARERDLFMEQIRGIGAGFTAVRAECGLSVDEIVLSEVPAPTKPTVMPKAVRLMGRIATA